MRNVLTRGGLIASGIWVLFTGTAHAGMTVYDLNDVVRLRLEDISFFGFLLVVSTFGVKFLWNSIANDFSGWPRLSWRKAFSLTCLLSIAMLLMLIIIAGARELLTPGAWYRQGSHYRPSESASIETRQESMRALYASLAQYAHSHQGQFPPHEFVPEVGQNLWRSPDSVGTRYIYVGGRTVAQTNAVMVCEPMNFGAQRLVLYVGGKIEPRKTQEIHKLLETPEKP